MRDLGARYDVINNDGTRMGEVVKGMFYSTQHGPVEGVLTERGLEGANGEILACWDDLRAGSEAPAYLQRKG